MSNQVQYAVAICTTEYKISEILPFPVFDDLDSPFNNAVNSEEIENEPENTDSQLITQEIIDSIHNSILNKNYFTENLAILDSLTVFAKHNIYINHKYSKHKMWCKCGAKYKCIEKMV